MVLRVVVLLLIAVLPVGAQTRVLCLAECVELAFAENRHRAVSQAGIELARAQLQQALSVRWPQATATSALTLRDEDPLFVFPSFTDIYDIELIGQALQTEVTVPEQRVELMDRTHFTTSVDLLYPLYIGGRRAALAKQGRAGLAAAQAAARRTDLEIARDVRRMYYGALLTRELATTGRDMLERMEVALALAEGLYQRGSGRVKKTDYLQFKVVVESVRILVAKLEADRVLARMGLAFTMGLTWDEEVEPAAAEIPFAPYEAELAKLVGAAYRFNPDWARLREGLVAFAAGVDERRGERLPRIALLGKLQLVANAHDAGLVDPGEKKSWIVGIGVEVPLFDGFLTRGRIREAQARLAQLESQQILLREGLALQVKAALLQVESARKQHQGAAVARTAAKENADLVGRAYRAELLEVRDLIEAQLMESLTRVQHLVVRYRHDQAQAELEFVVGRAVKQILAGEQE